MATATHQHQRQRIVQLAPEIVNRIAAGEVIERPAAVVKELGENSLDAGASRIEVEIEQGGKRLIRVRDNGHGIPAEELPLALSSHATSKLAESADLLHIASFGFRGEALASIASVAEVTLRSRPQHGPGGEAAEAGAEITARFGEVGPVRPCGCPPGTEVTVRELFTATPARFKFLKGSSAELGHVVEAVQRLALPNPSVAFSLTHENRLVFELPPAAGTRDRIGEFWGPACAESLADVYFTEPGLTIEGQIAAPSYTRPNATRIVLFVNGRHIRDRSLIAAVRDAYREFLPHGRYPAAVLHLSMPVEAYDVNVHPQKLEVRFREPRRLFARLKTAVRERLMQGGAPPRLALAERERGPLPTPPPPVAVPVPAAGDAAHVAGAGTDAGEASPPGMTDLLARILSQAPTTHEAPAPVPVPQPPSPYPAAKPAGRQPGAGAGVVAEAATAADGAFFARTVPTAAGMPLRPVRLPAGGQPATGSQPAAAADPAAAQPLTPTPASGSRRDAAGIAGLLAEIGGHGPAAAQAQQTPAHATTPASFTRGLRNLFQVGQRYLVLEYPAELALVDQHALHERVLFAQFEAKFRNRAIERQRLLLPEPLDLTRAEAATLDEPAIREALARLGFEVETAEQAEGYEARLIAVPALLSRRLPANQIKWIVEHTLAALRETEGNATPEPAADASAPSGPAADAAAAETGAELELPDVARRVIATLACKAALKAGEALNEKQALSLLVEADQLPVAATCPHGRPTTLRLSFDQLDNLFGR